MCVFQFQRFHYDEQCDLYVLPDLTRPALLSAVINQDGTVTLSFSKLLDAASATALELPHDQFNR
jgi:hypothetical protein